MTSRVRVNKHQLDYFRRLARDTDYEISACLIGNVVSPELTVIKEFAYPMEYAEQSSCSVRWYQQEYDEVKRSAEERGLRIVGDIHSHPEWDAVLSADDYKAHLQDGHRICGICSKYGRKTRVRFWIAESALPAEIEYVGIGK